MAIDEERRHASEAANLNVSRIVTLIGTNIAIFTFLLFFLYPRYLSGQIDSALFQATLILLGLAVFSMVFAVLFYYELTLTNYLDSASMVAVRRRGDLFWVLGYSFLLLDPALILYTVSLPIPVLVWLALWGASVYWTLREYKNVARLNIR